MKLRLNKNGWGLTEMLVLTGILVFFFFIAILLIYKFYSTLERDVIDTDSVNITGYEETESAIEHAANMYLDNKYANMNNINSITITMSKLSDMGYLTEFIYEDCDGYAISKIINGQNISDAYISCNNYKTPGFESWRVNE